MRGFFLLLLCLFTTLTRAQNLPVITFHGQPALEKGISLEPYALFYLDPSGDTLQPVSHIVGQLFVKPEKIPQIYNNANRIGMQETSQVFWQQFRISNTHTSDTLKLEYAGGVHAVYALYQKKGNNFSFIGSDGLCVATPSKVSGYSTLPIIVPPHTTRQYLVRIVNYLVLLDSVIGTLHTFSLGEYNNFNS